MDVLGRGSEELVPRVENALWDLGRDVVEEMEACESFELWIRLGAFASNKQVFCSRSVASRTKLP